MADVEAGAAGEVAESGERGTVAEELRRDPRPSVNRAALAAEYPSWGLATLALLVAGLIIGVVSLSVLGATYNGCETNPALLVCTARMHVLVVTLPVASLVAGLALALIGGRVVAKRRGSPMVPTAVGWAVFVVGTVVAYVLGGVF